MKLDFDIGGGLIESLELMGERAADIGKPLRQWAAYKRKDVKARIESGEGMPPLAASTLEKRSHTGTSRVTKHGNLRTSYAKRLDARSKRLRGLIAWTKKRYLGLGSLLKMPADAQKKVARWQKELAATNRQLIRSQDMGYADRKTGKSLLDKKGTKRLAKLPGSLRIAVKSTKDGHGVAVVYSKAGIIGKVHNDGGPAGNGAQIPACNYLRLTGKDVAVFKDLLVKHGVTVLGGG